MMRRFVLWLLSYSWWVLLLGVGLLGMAAYTTYKAGVGGKIPAEEKLVVQNGTITSASEVTVERRRRRTGSKTTKKHYELDLRTDNGENIKLRADTTVPRRVIEYIIDENVTVKYDDGDDNTTYVIQLEGKDLVSYETMAQISQSEADSDKRTFASKGAMGTAAVMVVVGIGGVLLRRKLAAGTEEDDDEDESDSSHAPVAPSEVKVGANVQDNTPHAADPFAGSSNATGAVFDKEAGFKQTPKT